MPTSSLLLRPYEVSDWPSLERVHDASRMDELRASVGVHAFLSLAQTAEGEGLFEGEVWVAVLDGRVVAFAAFTPAELNWLYVCPSRYRQGIGRALLIHSLKRMAPEVTTEVLVGNEAALSLYLAVGFTLERTVNGRLVGNEAFPASGHLLRYRAKTVCGSK